MIYLILHELYIKWVQLIRWEITGSFSLMTWQDKSEIRSVLLYDFQSRSYIFNQSKALSSLDRKRERSRLLQRWTSSLRRLSWPRIGLRRWHHRVQAAVCKFNRLTRVVSRLANLRIDKMLSSVDKGKVLWKVCTVFSDIGAYLVSTWDFPSVEAHDIDKCLRCKKSKTYGLAEKCIKCVLPGAAQHPHYAVGWIPGRFPRDERGMKLVEGYGGFGGHDEK